VRYGINVATERLGTGITKQLRRLVGKKNKVPTTPEDRKIIADLNTIKKIWPTGTWNLSLPGAWNVERDGADLDNVVRGDLPLQAI
jgi:hypothetical protein